MGTLAANLTASETILAGQIAELGQRISEVAAAKGWGDAAGPPENFFEAIQTQVERRLDAYGKRIEAALEGVREESAKWRANVEEEIRAHRQTVPPRFQEPQPLDVRGSVPPAPVVLEDPVRTIPPVLEDLPFPRDDWERQQTGWGTGALSPPGVNPQSRYKKWDDAYAKLWGDKDRNTGRGTAQGGRGRSLEGWGKERRAELASSSSTRGAGPTGSDKKTFHRLMFERLKGSPFESMVTPGSALSSAANSDDEGPLWVCRMTRSDRGEGMSDRGGGVSTFLHAQLMATNAPKFSGDEADWQEFSQGWAHYQNVIRETEGREVGDGILFNILELCVDEATKCKIRSERRRDVSLPFRKFWQGLEREFGRDQEGARRREWERVQLREGEISLASWRSYRVAFEAALSQVEGVSDREIEQKVLRDLPSNLREKLAREIARKAQEKMWVRIPKPCKLNAQELGMLIGVVLNCSPPKVEDRARELLIECRDEEFQAELLELDGWGVGGESLKVQWSTRRPDWQDMVKWVEKTLRVDQEVKPIVSDIRTVHAIAGPPQPTGYTSAINSGGKGKGKGGGKDRSVEFSRTPNPSDKEQVRGSPAVSPRRFNPGTQPRFSPRGGASNQQAESSNKGSGGAHTQTSPAKERVQKGVLQWGPEVCYPCQRAKRECLHPYWECKFWMETRWVTDKESSRPVAAEQPKESTPTAAEKGKGKGKGGRGQGATPQVA